MSAQVGARVRRHLPAAILLVLMAVLSVPLVRGFLVNPDLTHRVEQVRLAWMKTAARELFDPNYQGTGTRETERPWLGDAYDSIERAAYFSRDLQKKLESLVESMDELFSDPPAGSTARVNGVLAIEEYFQAVFQLVDELERRGEFAYRSLSVFLLLVVGGLSVSARLRTARLLALEDKRKSEARFNQLALSIQEQERYRIARELHDETAQNLALARMTADQIESPHVDQLNRSLTAAIESIRAACDRLRLPANWRSNPHNMLKALGSLFSEQHHLAVHLRVQGQLSVDWSEAAFLHTYRICQEALINVIRHTACRHATLTLDGTRTDVLVIGIEDEGEGLMSSPAGLGRTGMQERAELIGADLTWGSRDGIGTRVELIVPRRVAGAEKETR